MVHLAARDDDAPVPLAAIAASEELPTAFLERILARLRDGGLLVTTRGASGGYRLARDAAAISVADIVTAIEGPLSLTGCLPDESACVRARGCVSKRVWRRLDEAISEALDAISLDELVGPAVAP